MTEKYISLEKVILFIDRDTIIRTISRNTPSLPRNGGINNLRRSGVPSTLNATEIGVYIDGY